MMTISASLQRTMTSRLLIPIGQIAGRCREDQIRQHQAAGTDRQHGADVSLVDVLLADADHEPAQNIVVRGAKKLRQQQADKRRRPQAGVLRQIAIRILRLPSCS